LHDSHSRQFGKNG